MVNSEIRETILVLGGSGYIGSQFKNRFPRDNFIYFNRKDYESVGPEFYENVSVILNMSASKINATKEESRSANFDYPNTILNKVVHRSIKWVQAASYYELQVPKGRRDYYSLDKVDFRKFLNEKASENEKFRVTSLILPHVFGGSEAHSRIVPTLLKMNNGENVFYGSRNQLLPILHISDAVRALSEAIITEQNYCTPKSMWHGRLEDLVLKSSTSRWAHEKANFNNVSEIHQESELDYPELLDNFTPELNFDRFIQLLKNGEML
jgi:nucleoside-diphosphate-sugar epimerase